VDKYAKENGNTVTGVVIEALDALLGVRYFRFHPIRHSGASIMDGNNVPLGAIQRILGHENRKTTEIYLHSIGDLEREAINAFEQAREKSHTKSHTDGTQKKKELTG
jgi:integrase